MSRRPQYGKFHFPQAIKAPNYTDRNIVEKLFQTYTMRIQQFHGTWNGSQSSAEGWLSAYIACYNHHRSHQALDKQPPVEAIKQQRSIYQCLQEMIV